MRNILKIIAVGTVLLTSLGLAGAQAFAKTMGGAHMTGASVTAVSGTTLTVSKNNKSYTVDTGSNTKVLKNGATVSLSQISVGDHVNVAGSWADANKTAINAILIRDGWGQKNKGAFSGSVVSIDNTGFVLQLGKRGQATVVISSATKIVNKENMTITQSSIVVGNKVSVDGLWNRTSKMITATAIKDLSF